MNKSNIFYCNQKIAPWEIVTKKLPPELGVWIRGSIGGNHLGAFPRGIFLRTISYKCLFRCAWTDNVYLQKFDVWSFKLLVSFILRASLVVIVEREMVTSFGTYLFQNILISFFKLKWKTKKLFPFFQFWLWNR